MPITQTSLTTLFAFWLCLTASVVSAGSASDDIRSANSNWQLGLALGYGERSNPLLGGDNLPLVAVVDIAWYGDAFFFDNGDFGYTLRDDANITFNLVTRVNSERLFFENSNSLLVSFSNSGVVGNGTSSQVDDPNTPQDESSNYEEVKIPDRDYALDGGLELLTDGQWGFLQLSALHDVTKKHNGYELALSLGRSGYWRRFTWTTSAGVNYRSPSLNNYYYGVLSSEASQLLPAYRADGGFNWQVSTLVRYYLSRSLSLGLVIEYQALSSAIADSPFVTDDYVTTGYAGLKFSF
ncbi:MipA/OmpV family protein [Halioxenophilus sp. WMMB6]|uniref:MipA/OmpV family protein n=1 Tax=Halioxenophilus sp. WMMB6 TaxID=3073815 RepID=UPI00295E64C2|nr:MipA/OmpV family protein [Halioxenophilus sp. WMMB6]